MIRYKGEEMDSIRVMASATSANLGAGFDVLGLALEEPYDIVEVEKSNDLSIEVYGRGQEFIPLEPEKNTAGLVALEMGRRVIIRIKNGIRPGSGLGSSAAPAAGTAVAINELFNMGYTKKELVMIAAKGEAAAAGVAHADNVAPCIMGGLAIVRGDEVESVPMPEMAVVVVLPDIIVSTKTAREILPKKVSLEEMVANVGSVSMLMAGVMNKDPRLVGRSLDGTFNERYRAPLIDGYAAVKEAALKAGAYGVTISGSGPSIIAFCPEDHKADIAENMTGKFISQGVKCESFVTRIGKGVQIIK